MLDRSTTFGGEFGEHSPVPRIGLGAPGWWPVAVSSAVGKHVWPAVALPLEEAAIASTQPEVMRARSQTRSQRHIHTGCPLQLPHDAGAGLWSGNHQAHS